MKKICLWVLLIAGVMTMSGCAGNRGIIDFEVDSGTNPKSGKYVTIAKVIDSRIFEARPKKPSIPSLMGGKIDDVAIKARAIARKRNSYGMAMGDILLPEGRTVSNVIEEAVIKSLRDKGYVVVEKDSPDYTKAIPVEVDIQKFWGWSYMGLWAFSLNFEAEITMRGQDIFPTGDEEKIRGSITLHSQIADTRAWTNTLQRGLDNFIAAIKVRLK
jgi:hypothetical protein